MSGYAMKLMTKYLPGFKPLFNKTVNTQMYTHFLNDSKYINVHPFPQWGICLVSYVNRYVIIYTWVYELFVFFYKFSLKLNKVQNILTSKFNIRTRIITSQPEPERVSQNQSMYYNQHSGQNSNLFMRYT